MKNLKTISEKSDNKWQCEFCKRVLASEANLVRHTCVGKSRWQDRSTPTSRLAYQCWNNFYQETQPGKACTLEDFLGSQYYGAFWRFADFCKTLKVINIPQYQQWLLKNRHSIDRWATDTLYTKFLLYYLPAENALDSIYRSVETILALCADTEYKPRDYLRYAGRNRICSSITLGHITAWFLYNCDSGQDFIKALDQTQLDMIWEYIEPEPWQARFRLHADDQKTVREVLRQGEF